MALSTQIRSYHAFKLHYYTTCI